MTIFTPKKRDGNTSPEIKLYPGFERSGGVEGVKEEDTLYNRWGFW